MGILRFLLGADIVGSDDDESITVKGIYAANKEAAKVSAEKMARKEGIAGQLDIQERPDPSGGTYYRAIWRR